MPRGKPINGGKNVLPKFVSCTLSDEEVGAVQSHLLDPAGICDFIAKVTDSGIKVSIGYDEYNDTLQCVLTSKLQQDGTPALALASRGPGLAECVTASAYKYDHKLDGDLTNGAVADNKRAWS